jgi:lysophospholipase L1-like esterase
VVKFLAHPAVAIAGFFLFSAARALSFDDIAPPLRLTIVGDSTVATYDAKSPIHGWGEFIAARMRRRVQIHNLAAPGASSSTFIQKGLWDQALRDNPNVVLIQFGHNDSAQKIDPLQTQSNLQFLIESAREAGATPILITPMQMRAFNRGKLVPTLGPYADAARQVAARTGVAIIDLNTLSGELYERLGPMKTEQLASPGGDMTHFNRLGAQAMADIVLRELAQVRTPLTREILDPSTTFPAGNAPKASPAPGRKGKPRRLVMASQLAASYSASAKTRTV